MGFCGYRYRFSLYAAHSNITNSDENVHFHNFTISLYIDAANCKDDDNFKVERAVQDWFRPLQGQHLAQTELFREKETTVEGMGNTFFELLYDMIDKLGYRLVKLEIYENPIRVYAVSNKRLDNTVNEIASIPRECLPIILLKDTNSKNKNKEISEKDNSTLLIEEIEHDIMQESAITIEQKTTETDIPHSNAGCNLTINKQNKFIILIKLLLGLLCFITIAVVTMDVVKKSGRYPQGSDTFCHLYRADLILQNIKQGNWFPLYDKSWYNGVEIMRYWGPIPLYIIAGLEWILHSGVLDAYVLFLGTLIVLGGCGWLLWGYRYNRIELSILLGMIWFYMPENMRVVIYEGNLPRGVINALLPFYFYFIWRVMVEKKKKAILPLMFVTILITLCHLGITLMLIATIAIFTMLYSKMNHSVKSSLSALGASISGVLLAGLWVVPALIGGAASGSSTNQVMKNFFESAAVSLNPFTRLHGDALSFYFGLSVIIICIVGVIFGSKKVKPGFLTAIILFLCTTKSMFSLFSKLPFSQFLWMIRFIPIGLTAAMVSFIMWKQLRKWMVLLFSIILIADCSTSFQYIYFPKEERIQNVQTSIEDKAKSMLITEAKDITNQRMAILDLSKYGSFAPYYVAGVGKPVMYTFGAGWEGAGTARNIVNLNASVESGWYVYLFDRALELGNDTVLIPVDNLKEKSKDVDKVIASAKISGYNLINNNGTSLLFHKDTLNQFGVVTEYKNIAIGDSAAGIAMIFPNFEEGSKNNINDYTFEELCKYKIIYLSGFKYDNKSKAEELLLQLSESGVQVYIDMNRVPVDRAKKRMELFGVNAQSITFTESYPEFEYSGETYRSLDFSVDTSEWHTVYLDGLDTAVGKCNMTDKSFPYIGTSKNKNLHFVGLNIVYYLQSTRDLEINKLVEAIFKTDVNQVPNRTIVPISIQTSKDKIVINSDYDNVNTTLSSIDIFSSERDYRINNNLIVVDSGSTVIHISYSHVLKGILVTVVGILLAVLTYTAMPKRKDGEEHEEVKEKENT